MNRAQKRKLKKQAKNSEVLAEQMSLFEKLPIKCNIDDHGIFYQSYELHYQRGNGCPKCKYVTIADKLRLSLMRESETNSKYEKLLKEHTKCQKAEVAHGRH